MWSLVVVSSLMAIPAPLHSISEIWVGCGKLLNIRSSSCSATTNSKGLERKNWYTNFNFSGKAICVKTFLFMNGIDRTRYYNLVAHYRNNGLTNIEHKNNRQKAFFHNNIKQFKLFITNYATYNAGRYLGHRSSEFLLLLSDTTKNKVWKFYSECCIKKQCACLGRSTFYNLWNEL